MYETNMVYQSFQTLFWIPSAQDSLKLKSQWENNLHSNSKLQTIPIEEEVITEAFSPCVAGMLFRDSHSIQCLVLQHSITVHLIIEWQLSHGKQHFIVISDGSPGQFKRIG